MPRRHLFFLNVIHLFDLDATPLAFFIVLRFFEPQCSRAPVLRVHPSDGAAVEASQKATPGILAELVVMVLGFSAKTFAVFDGAG